MADQTKSGAAQNNPKSGTAQNNPKSGTAQNNTKSGTAQSKPAAADVARAGVQESKKAVEDSHVATQNAIDESKDWNQKAIEDSKKTIEEFRKSVEEFNEKAIEDTKKARNAYFDAYEKAALTAADLHEQSVEATDVEWVKTIVTAQAQASRELTKAYVNAARELDD